MDKIYRSYPDKRLLILTGPQGSGNHMWSKIFNTHSKSFGWNNEDYWEGHHTEPYNEYWANPEKMEGLIFPEEYNVTSISCPYWRDVTPQVPMYKEFIQNCQQLGVNVTVCVLSRDRNIIERQQKRVRGESTMQTFMYQLPHLYADYYLSYETLQIFKAQYLQKIQYDLQWPIDITKCVDIISEDTNEKYIHDVERQPLDALVEKVSLES